MGAYKLFFSWWLDTTKHYIKHRDQFSAEIQERIPILFSDYGARIVPDTEEYPRAFDYVVVTVAIENMLLRFIQGRGEFRVHVTPVRLPAAWREISTVIANSELFTSEAKSEYYAPRDFGRFFHSHFPILKHEVNKEGWKPPRS